MNLMGADILILAGADIGNLVHADRWYSVVCLCMLVVAIVLWWVPTVGRHALPLANPPAGQESQPAGGTTQRPRSLLLFPLHHVRLGGAVGVGVR